MSTHTETITVSCPHVNGTPEVAEPCGAESEVEITFGWDPGQRGGEWEPYLAPGVEDVEGPDITCDSCGHVFTQLELDAIAKDFTPSRQDDDREPEERSSDWDDPRFNWDINGRCAP